MSLLLFNILGKGMLWPQIQSMNGNMSYFCACPVPVIDREMDERK